MGRTIFIGDVHGCLEELKLMIKYLKLKREDRVILLGDLINRGPDPAGVVEFVCENQFECILGNHEYEYLHEYKENPVYKELHLQLKKYHNWLKALPYWIEGKNFLAVHAGLQPDTSLEETPIRSLLFIRTWNPDAIASDKGIPWYEFYCGEKLVIYGHWAKKGLTIRKKTLGLDSGCVYGKFLSAFILEESKIVQIPAIKQHYIPPSLRKKQFLS